MTVPSMKSKLFAKLFWCLHLLYLTGLSITRFVELPTYLHTLHFISAKEVLSQFGHRIYTFWPVVIQMSLVLQQFLSSY